MGDDFNDIGPCPICTSEAWKYTEVERWAGRKCKVCEATVLHQDLAISEGDR